MIEKVRNFLKKYKKTLIISLVCFLFVVTLTVGPIFVSAVLTFSAQQNAAVQAKNSTIEAAIINNDYATWSSLVNDEKLKAKITAQNFPQYAEAYRLLQQGKLEEADLIKKQLSLKQEFQVTEIKSQLINNAIANNDYNAWRSIVGTENPQVTADNFSTYAKAYTLLAQGNLNKADILKRSIGVKNDVFNSSR